MSWREIAGEFRRPPALIENPVYSSGVKCTGMEANSRGVISLATLLKESLIASARSVSLKKDPSMLIHESGAGFDRPDISLMLLHHFFMLVPCIWLTMSW